jgi:hypothetical protein
MGTHRYGRDKVYVHEKYVHRLSLLSTVVSDLPIHCLTCCPTTDCPLAISPLALPHAAARLTTSAASQREA